MVVVGVGGGLYLTRYGHEIETRHAVGWRVESALGAIAAVGLCDDAGFLERAVRVARVLLQARVLDALPVLHELEHLAGVLCFC